MNSWRKVLTVLGRLTLIIAIFAAFGSLPTRAQEDDFTFKRVSPPKAGQKKKINIQVERTWPFKPPQSNGVDPDGVEDGSETADASPPSEDDWFWKVVSTDLKAADSIRLDHALTTLNANSAQKALISPDLAVMDKIVSDHGQDILLATAGKRVSPAFALAVIAVESAGRIDAKSEKGAMGLHSQAIMPEKMQSLKITGFRRSVKPEHISLKLSRLGIVHACIAKQFPSLPMMGVYSS